MRDERDAASTERRPTSVLLGRRGFIGAGLATAGAAVAGGVPRATASAPSVPFDLFPPAVNPSTHSLVPIPAARVAAAVGALDSIVNELMSRTGVPGVAVAVVQGSRLLYAKGFGVRNLRTGLPVNAQTVFHLASVSKSLSATVVAGIVGRRLIGWDDPIIRNLPSFALSDPYVTRHVSYADLFSHRSGLPNHAGDLLEDLGYSRPYILHALRLEKLAPFRSSYAYTNFGLTGAAVAAANAMGGEWAAVANKLLLQPLGMRSTTYRYSQFVKYPNRAAMHVRANGRWVQKFTRDADPEAPAGGAHSNVLDLAKWMILRLADGRWNGRQLINGAPLLEVGAPRLASSRPTSLPARSGFYGFGTDVSCDYSGRIRLSHSGAFDQGAATNYVLLPDQQLGIVTLTNGMPIGIPEAIGQYFMDLVIGGQIENDWLDLYMQAIAHSSLNPSRLAHRNRPAHPKPARPLVFYTGRYRNSYYGAIRVVLRRGKLHVMIGPRPTDYQLEHWSGDEFAFLPVGENALGISAATFTAGRGHAKSLTLEYYDTTGLGTFIRS